MLRRAPLSRLPREGARGGATIKTILIAEGDDRVAELFAYLFAREGWTVTLYRDGERAADALGTSASYDAVLVSNRLRDMGGWR